MFSFFKNRSSNKKLIARLYHSIAQTALRPVFFEEYQVPDTLEGRFEILALHMAVVLRHVKQLPAPAEDVARDLTDYYFEQLDDVLRELGTSDNKVPKKMKQMAGAFLHRAGTYDAALAAQDMEQLKNALAGYFGPELDTGRLAGYVLDADRTMYDFSLDMILENGISFPASLRIPEKTDE
jgi:Uncharacterized conserved protein